MTFVALAPVAPVEAGRGISTDLLIPTRVLLSKRRGLLPGCIFEWDFQGSDDSSGKVRQMMRLRKINGQWLITAERDLNLIYKK